MNQREAYDALWLAWFARAQLERDSRGHDPADTDTMFADRERVGFRRWMAKQRASLPGFAPHGSRRPPRDQGGN
jgi:hypothetical protein